MAAELHEHVVGLPLPREERLALIVSPWAEVSPVPVLDGGAYRLDRTVTDRLTKWGVDVVLSDVF